MKREWNLRNARPDLLALLWLCAGLSVSPQVCEGRDPHVAFGTRGAVVANDPLAVDAGMRVLQEGGNAFDAAVAVGAAINVVEPDNSHLGGHALIMLYHAARGKVMAINGTGPAPRKAKLEDFVPEGVPQRGIAAALVPGEIDAYVLMLEEYGTMSLRQVLQPAIELAERMPVAPWFARRVKSYAGFKSIFPRSVASFLVGAGGQPPGIGASFSQPDLARTLRHLAEGGRDSFYCGEIAAAILAESQRGGGYFTEEDFREYPARLMEPIATTYRGYTVYEQPLVSQGFLLLEALNIAEGYDLPQMGPRSVDGIHVLVESMKLAFADRYAFAGDPDFVDVPMEHLLSKEYAQKRRADISMHSTLGGIPAGRPKKRGGDTTTYVVADGEGNLVSVVQSLWNGFGAAVIPEGTGIFMNNRMTDFSLDPHSPNVLAGGKRPLFTLNSFILVEDGEPILVGGTPGDYGQVQWNLQVITNMIDGNMTAAVAVAEPRWRYHGPKLRSKEARLAIEEGTPAEVVRGLAARGQPVQVGGWAGNFSLIRIYPDSGVLEAIGDSRTEGRSVGAW